MIDFNKPIRFTDDNAPAHLIGQRIDGRFVIEGGEDKHSLFCVDENGLVPSWRSKIPLIENTPERIKRWIIAAPTIGYESKDEALRAAEAYTGEHLAVVKIEFEVGERP